MTARYQSIKTVLFDLDGTLINSIPDIAAALNSMRGAFNLQPVNEETIKNIVGKGFPTTVKKVLALDLNTNDIQSIYNKAYNLTLQAYSKHLGVHTTVFPGVRETLQYLKDRHIKMAVVTNKENQHAVDTLKHQNLDSFFELVVGGNVTDHYKPHPAPVFYCLNHLNTSAEEAILVGDSESDIEAAKRAGVYSVAVNYGYNHGRDIKKSDPGTIISNITELKSLIG